MNSLIGHQYCHFQTIHRPAKHKNKNKTKTKQKLSLNTKTMPNDIPYTIHDNNFFYEYVRKIGYC